MGEVVLKVGDRLEHPQYGQVEVEFIGTEYVGLKLDDARRVLVRQMDFLASLAASQDEDVAEAEPPRLCAWPESTFQWEEDEGEDAHPMAEHWTPFAEDPGVILRDLPGYLAKAQPVMPFAQLGPGHGVPADWPRGYLLASPRPTEGLTLVIGMLKEGHVLVSAFPHTHGGAQYPVKIKTVHVWPSGLEAQVEVTWGRASLSFYDARYLLHRAHYEHGQKAEFLLHGLAYVARKAEKIEQTIHHHPDERAWFNSHLAPGQAPMPETSVLSSGSMTILIPASEGDRDEYVFRGPIISVRPFDDWLGQEGWRVEVKVIREAGWAGEDLLLPIFITRRVWEEEAPPRVGMEIDGVLWLQGALVWDRWVTPRAMA